MAGGGQGSRRGEENGRREVEVAAAVGEWEG
jgi:hypothetical protein